jgi:hypothetical protein
MEDIICTVPEACGESDCPVGWHLAHYWQYDDGTFSVCDSDGNHDDCDESDVPTADEQSAAWLDYSRHVAATGCDPLGEFASVPRMTKRKERYTASFRKSIIGAALVAVRRAGKVVPLRDLPQRVIEYLDAERLNGAAGNLRFRDGWDKLIGLDCVKLYRGTARVTFTLDAEEPRPAAAVDSDLRRAARRRLRKSKASK